MKTLIGRVRLNNLTEQHIATLYAELAKPRRVTITHARSSQTVDRALSPATRRYVHAVLHGALQPAEAWRLIERNPAAGASLPRASSPEMRPPHPAEARRFLAAAESHRLVALLVLAITTGMRQGELLALRWRDIDWSARRVAVRHTLVRLDGRWWLGDPKTASSQRAIDVTAPTPRPAARAPRPHRGAHAGGRARADRRRPRLLRRRRPAAVGTPRHDPAAQAAAARRRLAADPLP
ncbi:MAG: tyrosine-type recombinase/integrase [Chloroflexi bacterium]|nr:tyrosine-type recombinase/integrase [Chloroflexota bacterium]